MRKLIAIFCLITFIALQYGKIVSYWHCRLTAPVNCDCQKTLVTHSEKEHAATPLMIAKEKTEEVFLVHELLVHPFTVIPANTGAQSLYQSLIPADHTAAVFQPPRA